MEKNKSELYYNWAVIGFIGFLFSLGMGFYKMFAYENDNGEYSISDDSINAYVGGDAYNLIINGTYTTAYFILAGIFLMFAIGMLILDKLNQLVFANVNDPKLRTPEQNPIVKENESVIKSNNVTNFEINKETPNSIVESDDTFNNRRKEKVEKKPNKIYFYIIGAWLVFAVIMFALNYEDLSDFGVTTAEQQITSVQEMYDQEEYEQVINSLTSKGNNSELNTEEIALYSNSIFNLFESDSDYYIENVHRKINKDLLSVSDTESISSQVRDYLHERRNAESNGGSFATTLPEGEIDEREIYEFMKQAYNEITNYGADYVAEIHDPQVANMASIKYGISADRAGDIYVKFEMQ